MTLLQAIILGIVQGLTEFIPVSSTAHLVFASRAVGLFEGADAALRAQQTTATIAVIQLGTLVAVLIYFARDILNISTAFIRDHLGLVSAGAAVGLQGDGARLLSQLTQQRHRQDRQPWAHPSWVPASFAAARPGAARQEKASSRLQRRTAGQAWRRGRLLVCRPPMSL